MFTFFEKLLEPFPAQIATRPPATLFAFCLHYTRGVWPWLFLMAFLVAVVSVLEVLLFGFLGNLVDWLTNTDKNNFLENEGGKLFWVAIIIVVVLPLVSTIYSIVMHQTVLGNYPMRIRWLAHRYLLHQSFGFYQDEFAGRVATKVMQTALGVRETIMTVIDVIVYVGVYFIGALILVGSFDFWLMLPFLAWLVLYTVLLGYFLPRLRKISALQADARSTMTGRVVDSYTNIMTVKLFAHAGHERQHGRFYGDGVSHDASIESAGYLHQFSQRFTAVLCRFRFALGMVERIYNYWRNNRGDSTSAAIEGHVALDYVGTVHTVRKPRYGARRHEHYRQGAHCYRY